MMSFRVFKPALAVFLLSVAAVYAQQGHTSGVDVGNGQINHAPRFSMMVNILSMQVDRLSGSEIAQSEGLSTAEAELFESLVPYWKTMGSIPVAGTSQILFDNYELTIASIDWQTRRILVSSNYLGEHLQSELCVSALREGAFLHAPSHPGMDDAIRRIAQATCRYLQKSGLVF